jgi:hypothetical protein
MNNHFFVSSNSPNPFETYSEFKIYKATNSNVQLALYDVIGNLITNENVYLENGIHNFSLNAGNIIPGIYFLSMQDGTEKQILKLVKTGNYSGNFTSIVYNGKESSNFAYNVKEKGSMILSSGDLYSFKCYSNGYQDVLMTNISFNNNNLFTVTFLLNQLKKYNINSGYINIGGINLICNFHNFYNSSAPIGNYDTSGISTFKFDVQHILQNQNMSYNSQEFYSQNGKFIDCLYSGADSLITDFCYKSFSGGINTESNTLTASFQFNDNLKIIDKILIESYYYEYYLTSDYIGYGTQEINSKIILNAIPFIIDEQNNIIVEINGSDIRNYYLNITYSNKYNNYWRANWKSESYESTGLSSDDGAAYIKITLSPNP